MQRWLVLIFAGILVAAPVAGAEEPFIAGADVSFLPRVEAGGGVFFSQDRPADLFSILRGQGFDSIRLRLWHTPLEGQDGLAAVLELAVRAQEAGFTILLDIHYSDTWADPGHQTKPAAWASATGSALADSVRAYTRDALVTLDSRGVRPAIVQIGNEITQGMLWDEGRVGGSIDSPALWNNLASLLKAAAAGIHDAVPTGPRPEILIHIDRSGDNSGARWFFDNLMGQGVEFDLIGLSYYPWWHGSLADFQSNLNDLAVRYGKGIVVVETAYPWTLRWFDDTHNPVGMPEHLLPGYPATPEGQQAFTAKVLEIVKAVPGNRGRGVFWWAPEWVATEGFGSSWENLTLFDDEGHPLPALEAFSPTPDD